MIQRVWVCLLFGSMAWGQVAGPASAPPAEKSATQSAADAKAPEASNLPPDSPVITIAGVCETGDKTSPSCKTVITRGQFEEIVSALGPNMPPAARRQLAVRYGGALLMAQKAHEMGLDQGPKYEQLIKLQRLQMSANLVSQAVQQKAAEVPDKDIEAYYNKNLEAYQEVSFERLFVPHTKQLDTPKIKLSPEANQKRQDEAAAVMKKEAETLRARAVAGEDFAKLQAEAYTIAGLKSTPPSQKLNKARRNSLPPAQAAVFDLKPGEVSPVIADMSGFFVYKVVNKDTLPLTQVHDEIFGSLKSEKVQEAMKALQQSAAPELNDQYFGPAETPGANTRGPNIPNDSGPPRPGPKPPTLGPK